MQHLSLRLPLLSFFMLASACSGPEEEPVAPSAPVAEARVEPASEGEGDDRVFGEAPSADRELTPLSAIAANPERYAGQTVKTEGEISQVCQRMGCWMELRAEGVEPLMVPMAGHSFFLPRDVTGSEVVVEGEVALRERSANEVAHLESEGATASARAVQITATGVAIQ